MTVLRELEEAITRGDRETADNRTRAAVENGRDEQEILDAMTRAMEEIGQRFQRHEIFVPEMLIAARAMKAGMAVLEPRLVAAGIVPAHKAVIGTVQGDIHDIGKNLVSMMWQGANIEVVDLGNNVPPERFAVAVRETGARLVGLSALLTTTMAGMQGTIEVIREAGDPSTRVVVGGAPVTEEYARDIGADGYAADASRAVDLARKLLAD